MLVGYMLTCFLYLFFLHLFRESVSFGSSNGQHLALSCPSHAEHGLSVVGISLEGRKTSGENRKSGVSLCLGASELGQRH